MSKEMLINAVDEEEVRIAVVEDGELQELYIERSSLENHVGNIYKGRVTNVEPSIQAAFVDYGLPKNGFLHVSDVIPSYYGETRDGHNKPPIQKILKRGQEVIVQVSKEGIGTKGATLTTYLSIAGRFLVLMPGLNRVGVSRKIEDDEERHKLRETLEGLDRPKNMGVIIRTAGLNEPKKSLQQDLNYLDRVWKLLMEQVKSAKCPSEIFRESDLVARTIRDIFTNDITRIYVDSEDVARRAAEFFQVAMPQYADRVQLYAEKLPLFHRYGLEEEIDKIYSRRVPLASGGGLVIDQAEALVAIDVNSGRYHGSKNAEEAALALNLEAAREIVRQLRLRDLGGVIVMDFVDMKEEKHRRELENLLKNEMKRDRARSKMMKTSKFGIIEMTRQRVRPSLERSTFQDCTHCAGSGMIKTPESMSLDVMRQLTLAVSQDDLQQIEVTVNPAVGHYVNNRKRHMLVRLEEKTGKRIMVISDPTVGQESVTFHCQDNRGIPLKFDPKAVAAAQRARMEEEQNRLDRELQDRERQEKERQAAEAKKAAQSPGGQAAPAVPLAEGEVAKPKRRRRGRRKSAAEKKAEMAAAAAAAEAAGAGQAPTVEAVAEVEPPALVLQTSAQVAAEAPIEEDGRLSSEDMAEVREAAQETAKSPSGSRRSAGRQRQQSEAGASQGQAPAEQGQPAPAIIGEAAVEQPPAGDEAAAAAPVEGEVKAKPKRRRRRRRTVKKPVAGTADAGENGAGGGPAGDSGDSGESGDSRESADSGEMGDADSFDDSDAVGNR